MSQSHFFNVDPTTQIHYVVDDHTDPWTTPSTLVLVHGNAESTLAWYAWIPYLARHHRVIRMDIRGFGQSTPMAADYEWQMATLINDITQLLNHLGIEKAHFIGAKSGGSMVLAFAALQPNRVHSLIAVTPPVVAAARVSLSLQQIEQDGVKSWARASMQGRLGQNVSEAEINFWVNEVQGRTARSTLQGYLRWVPKLDIREDVKKITCPSLIITTQGNGLRSVDSVRSWQQELPQSELLVIEGDAWHAAGAYPDQCAQASARFLSTLF
ncbi:MAG: alpha/beta hydrolase [Betaproteobacteria bacterium]|jgi:pimeloyl-ACP methyl ester carboxylesterase